MKTISVTAHYERKLNTGNYSSVTLSTWATVELEEGDTEDEATAHAMNICREAVREAAQPFVKKAPVNGKVTPGLQQGIQDDLTGAAAGWADYWKE